MRSVCFANQLSTLATHFGCEQLLVSLFQLVMLALICNRSVWNREMWSLRCVEDSYLGLPENDTMWSGRTTRSHDPEYNSMNVWNFPVGKIWLKCATPSSKTALNATVYEEKSAAKPVREYWLTCSPNPLYGLPKWNKLSLARKAVTRYHCAFQRNP